MDANLFLEIVNPPTPGKQVNLRFGYIDSTYVSGRPKVKFDGQDAPGVKTYPYLSSYNPTANDRVMIIQNVVVGKIV